MHSHPLGVTLKMAATGFAFFCVCVCVEYVYIRSYSIEIENKQERYCTYQAMYNTKNNKITL